MLRKIFGGSKSKRSPFVAGIVIALVSIFGVATMGGGQASASTSCDGGPNDIIHGGFSSPADFINKVKSGSDNLNHHDLQAIYKNYHLTPADYDNFAAHAVAGIDKMDGTIWVGNQKVGTDGFSIGRLSGCQGSGVQSVPIAGAGTYYGNVNSKNLLSDVPVTVLFNSDGQMQFAVIGVCGNPSKFTPVVPTYSCDALNAAKDSGKANTYNFTTDTSVSGNAAIEKVVYHFGDGTPDKEASSPSTPVSHTYKIAGTFTATVTVYVSLPGGNHKTIIPVGHCTKVMPPVVLPAFECVQLSRVIVDKEKLEFSFTATAKMSGGPTLTGGDFDFGDSTAPKTGVKPNADGKTVTVNHVYGSIPDSGYSTKATLHFSVDGAPVTADTCSVLVTTTKVTPECKPGVPVGDVRCNPCPSDASLPVESPKCAPPELPKTGAGNTIAIFAAVVIGGFLVYRQLLFRGHRAAFMAAEQGSSLLPLADPLDDETPLAGTPLVGKKSNSFRRKRIF